MINLLSPSIKEQLAYSRRNRAALHYLRLTVVVLVVLGAVFVSSIYYIEAIVAKSKVDAADKTAEIASYDQVLSQAKEASRRLGAIQAISSKQTHFYRIIQELGAAMPSGAAMDGITLTSDTSQPVTISVTGPSYDSILTFKDNLSKSSIIASVSLINVGTADVNYRSSMTIVFKNLGQLK